MTEIRSVAVIGAGLMGHAIGLVHALGGCRVVLQDNNAGNLAAAPGLVAAALDTLIEAEAADADKAEILGRISTEPDLAKAVAEADLVVEAVTENVEIKRSVFAAIDAAARPDVIIASNTSHLDIFPLVPEGRLARTAVAHWYTPPYIIDLVDVTGAETTDPAVVDALATLYRGMGKKPVVFKEFLPSYIANRLQAAMGLEIYDLLDKGLATPEMIDDSIKYGLALRMATLGHLMKADFTGLDMVRRSMSNATYDTPPPRQRSTTLEALIADGKGGVMTGAGFFDYGGKTPAELFRERDLGLLRIKKTVAAVEADHPLARSGG